MYMESDHWPATLRDGQRKYAETLKTIKFRGFHNFHLEIVNFYSRKNVGICIGSFSPVVLVMSKIYYSNFDKGQNFNYVCRRSCVSDTKNFMIDM